MRARTAAWLFACVVLTGCAGNRPIGGSPGLTVVEGNKLPAPSPLDILGQARPYLLGPYDELSIEVYGVEDLSRKVQVDAAGRVSLPLAGTFDVSGKTPAELETLIEASFRDHYIRDPQVTVNITETNSQVMTVEGNVGESGIYPVVGRMTLIRAIARAKGTAEFAKLSRVVVFRTVGGQRMAALYDLRAIQQGAYEDPEIYANDVIVVSEDRARMLFRDAMQGAGLITTPIVALIQQ
jgi:polysaccharide export outer membrane protein